MYFFLSSGSGMDQQDSSFFWDKGRSIADAAFVSWVPPMDKMGVFNPLKYRNMEVNWIQKLSTMNYFPFI